MGSGRSKPSRGQRGSKSSLKRIKSQSKRNSSVEKGKDTSTGDSKSGRPIGLQHEVQKKSTGIAQRSALDIYAHPDKLRMCSIVCTIGPKTATVEMLTKLRKAGMNVVRMNFSHGSYEYHGGVVDATRESVASDPLDGSPIAIALDTKGPEIRTGLLEGDDIELVKGNTIVVTTDPSFKEKCSVDKLFMDYANLPKVLPVGGVMHVDDGLISLKATSIDGTDITCEILNSGMLGSKKGVNLPEVDVDLPALSEKDKKDLQFGVEKGVDMVFASFIRKKDDVKEVRACLGEAGKSIKIISKIENHEGVRNFDEILEETDGVMVARGDLGIEIAPEKVFLAQKMMIAKCNLAGKPVICATQMLESMTKNPRPTRAEVSDVANAVLDGSDCVMLSGETAKGAYPEAAVTMMANICKEAEAAVHHKSIVQNMSRAGIGKAPHYPTTSEGTALSIVTATTVQNIKAIVTLTNTGISMSLIAKFKPACPIIVVSRDAQVCRQAHLHRGCVPFEFPDKEKNPEDTPAQDRQKRVNFAMKLCVERKIISAGDTIIVANGMQTDNENISLCKYQIQQVV